MDGSGIADGTEGRSESGSEWVIRRNFSHTISARDSALGQASGRQGFEGVMLLGPACSHRR